MNTVPIRVPALHERREDIPILFRKFASDFAEKYRTETLRLDDSARLLLSNYRWPGNIRELRNLVEQLSVLSEDHLVSDREILLLAPQLGKRNLPASANIKGQSEFEEREILYKFLFEMKNDINDLKNLVFELVQRNNLEMPSLPSRAFSSYESAVPQQMEQYQRHEHEEDFNEYSSSPVLIREQDDDYQSAEEVEESLSLEQKTKELILKALKKHKGRRKDAAEELGISERTLYRKIKEYDIAI